MAPSASAQKALVAQFVGLTGAADRYALRYLKVSNFNLNHAVDSYFAAGHEPKGPSALEQSLTALFDSLRGNNDESDKLELESTMEYFGEKLKVSLEDASLFVVQELLQAPSIGEVTRQGFVEGWKRAGVPATPQDQAQYLKAQIKALSSDLELFKRVYKYAFVTGREKDQKALSLENANVYWSMLFNEPGMRWKSQNQDWLQLWKDFLAEKYTRSVNRDMWNMALTFALKSMEDETLSFWSEDGAWPSVIDDFVAWCRQKGIAKAEVMEVDDN